MFALGGPGNIDQETFNKQKAFIKQFIDSYGTSEAGIRVGIINYGRGSVPVRFNNFNRQSIKLIVDNAQRLPQGGQITSGLQKARTDFFGNRQLVRPNATKAFIVLHGDSIGQSTESLSTAANPLRNGGVLVISVSAGGIPNKAKQAAFASGAGFVFDFRRLVDIPKIVPRVYQALLKGGLCGDIMRFPSLSSLKSRARCEGSKVAAFEARACQALLKNE